MIFTSKEILAGALVFVALCVPVASRAATARAFGTLAVQVRPEAQMMVTPEVGQDPSGAQGSQTQLQVAVTVRINSGTTASLWLVPTGSTGDARTLLLTVTKNGRYSFTAPVPSNAGSGNSYQVELVSSDQALQLVYNVPLP